MFFRQLALYLPILTMTAAGFAFFGGRLGTEAFANLHQSHLQATGLRAAGHWNLKDASCVGRRQVTEVASLHVDRNQCVSTGLTDSDRALEAELCAQAREGIRNAWFDTDRQVWVIKLWENYCAPAALCWGGLLIGCDGIPREFEEGED